MKQWLLEKQGQLRLFSLLIMTATIIWPISGYCEIQVWTDENGVKHFSNISPPTTEQLHTTLRYYTKNNSNIKFIPITINNVPLDVIIDTGASFVSLNTNSIRQLNIKNFLKEIPINTANGITRGYLFIADSIKVGDIKLNNIHCIYLPNSQENLLGSSLLTNFNYFFNEREQTISFITRKEIIQYREPTPQEKQIIRYEIPIKKESHPQEIAQQSKKVTEYKNPINEDLQSQNITQQQDQPLPLPQQSPAPIPIESPTPNTQETNIYSSFYQRSPLLSLYFIIAIPLHLIIIWFLVLAEILKSEFTGSNKTMWVLVVILLPIIGIILYWIIGTKQRIDPNLDIDNINDVRKYKRLKFQ